MHKPPFSAFMILSLFMVLTTVAISACRSKNEKINTSNDQKGVDSLVFVIYDNKIKCIRVKNASKNEDQTFEEIIHIHETKKE